MEITKTLLINAACLLIPPVVVVLLLRHFFPRKIRWSAGVVALVDLVIFWTDISYYESVWLTLFFVVIQLAIELSYASLHFYYVYWGFWHYQSAKHTDNKHLDTEARIGCFASGWFEQ